MQMGTVQVSFVRSPCSLPCPSLSPVSVQWSSNKVHFCFVRPGPTSAVRLITLTGRFLNNPGCKEHRFYYRKDREMSLMPPTRERTHTVCPIWPQQILHVEKQYMLLLVLGLGLPACGHPSTSVCRRIPDWHRRHQF